MRIDIVTIFPDYLRALELSLVGKARAAGLLDVRIHDLRDHAYDRHRTVDDTPYGGGPGMVMKPEPWGDALDAIIPEGSTATLIVPTPSGVPFSQVLAGELSARGHLVFAGTRASMPASSLISPPASRFSRCRSEITYWPVERSQSSRSSKR
jgi:tRNA (guanine37-N1)-methyltransferase